MNPILKSGANPLFLLSCKFVPGSEFTLPGTTSFPGPFLYFEKVPWVLNSTLSTLSGEANVALLYGRYFEKEASYLSEILPGQLLRLYLNYPHEYEMLRRLERVFLVAIVFVKR